MCDSNICVLCAVPNAKARAMRNKKRRGTIVKPGMESIEKALMSKLADAAGGQGTLQELFNKSNGDTQAHL